MRGVFETTPSAETVFRKSSPAIILSLVPKRGASDGMRDMDDSVVYTEPEDYFDEFGDSLAEPMPADGVYYTEPEQEGEVDEFEVVTGPE